MPLRPPTMPPSGTGMTEAGGCCMAGASSVSGLGLVCIVVLLGCAVSPCCQAYYPAAFPGKWAVTYNPLGAPLLFVYRNSINALSRKGILFRCVLRVLYLLPAIAAQHLDFLQVFARAGAGALVAFVKLRLLDHQLFDDFVDFVGDFDLVLHRFSPRLNLCGFLSPPPKSSLLRWLSRFLTKRQALGGNPLCGHFLRWHSVLHRYCTFRT